MRAAHQCCARTDFAFLLFQKVTFFEKSVKFKPIYNARADVRAPNILQAHALDDFLRAEKFLVRARPCAHFYQKFRVGIPPLPKKCDF